MSAFATTPGDSAPTLLPMTAPLEPTTTIVGHTPIREACVTSITRRWPKGHRRDCGLCPGCPCTLAEGVCQVVVPIFVPAASCPVFRRS